LALVIHYAIPLTFHPYNIQLAFLIKVKLFIICHNFR